MMPSLLPCARVQWPPGRALVSCLVASISRTTAAAEGCSAFAHRSNAKAVCSPVMSAFGRCLALRKATGTAGGGSSTSSNSGAASPSLALQGSDLKKQPHDPLQLFPPTLETPALKSQDALPGTVWHCPVAARRTACSEMYFSVLATPVVFEFVRMRAVACESVAVHLHWCLCAACLAMWYHSARSADSRSRQKSSALGRYSADGACKALSNAAVGLWRSRSNSSDLVRRPMEWSRARSQRAPKGRVRCPRRADQGRDDRFSHCLDG